MSSEDKQSHVNNTRCTYDCYGAEDFRRQRFGGHIFGSDDDEGKTEGDGDCNGFGIGVGEVGTSVGAGLAVGAGVEYIGVGMGAGEGVRFGVDVGVGSKRVVSNVKSRWVPTSLLIY